MSYETLLYKSPEQQIEVSDEVAEYQAQLIQTEGQKNILEGTLGNLVVGTVIFGGLAMGGEIAPVVEAIAPRMIAASAVAIKHARYN